jgi:DNA-binding MarR family transcriptional regulator
VSDNASAVEPSANAAEDYRLQAQIGFILRRAHQRHLAIFSSRIGDLTPPQFAALARLRELGEVSQNQLGTLIAMDAATVKGVIGRLKSRGLVTLGKHEADRRRLMVGLTDDGRRLVDELIPLARDISAETLAPLTRAQAGELLFLLARIT